jgi:hypothetical protein
MVRQDLTGDYDWTEVAPGAICPARLAAPDARSW